MLRRLNTLLLAGAALAAALPAWAQATNPTRGARRLEREVRRELLMLPFLSVFDHFAFRIEGDTVRLMGKVSRPSLRTDAESVVKQIEGVEAVRNEVEVLPLSNQDDRLRLALYRAIYGHAALQTLAVRAQPPIRILVENGRVTLEGVVATGLQRTVAGARANSVSGVFEVVNNLRLDSES